MAEDSTERLEFKTAYKVLEDEIEIERRKETFPDFMERAIIEIEKDTPYLGKLLKQFMDEAPTQEEKERIFEIAYLVTRANQIRNTPEPAKKR